jgi:hypothetical protein
VEYRLGAHEKDILGDVNTGVVCSRSKSRSKIKEQTKALEDIYI